MSARLSVSRVLFYLIIYLGSVLPLDSSGSNDSVAGCSDSCLLAVGRVYLLRWSPSKAVSSYLTRFILTDSFREQAVSFLWHFP